RFVWNFDVFDQGRDDRIAPALIDEIPKLLGIQHATGPRNLCRRMLSPARDPTPRALYHRSALTKAATGDPRLRLDQCRCAGAGAAPAASGRDCARWR